MSDTPKRPEALFDLHRLSEDQRIAHIGHMVIEHGKTIGVLVDDDPGRAARYIRKMRERYPGAVLLDQEKGPVEGVVTLRFGPQA